MFNFIVIGDDESWLKSGEGIVHKSRFPEYTTQETLSKLPDDNLSMLAHIRKLPTLFTYEGDNSKIFLTYINEVKLKDKELDGFTNAEIRFVFNILKENYVFSAEDLMQIKKIGFDFKY